MEDDRTRLAECTRLAERDRLAECERRAEEAYALMYEALGSAAAGACWSEAREWLTGAIAAAQRLGLEAEAARLTARLAHIRKVYESQMAEY